MAKSCLFGRIVETGHFLRIHHFPQCKVLGIYFIDFINAFQTSLTNAIPYELNVLEVFPVSDERALVSLSTQGRVAKQLASIFQPLSQ